MKEGRRQKAVSRKPRSAGALRLGRRTVRKGFAFPTASFDEFGKAAPCPSFGGEASRINLLCFPESHRLSARCGSKAAVSLVRVFLLLLTAHCTLPTAFGQFSLTQ